MPKTAVVLFNLGGPDSLEAIEPFLYNLFLSVWKVNFSGERFYERFVGLAYYKQVLTNPVFQKSLLSGIPEPTGVNQAGAVTVFIEYFRQGAQFDVGIFLYDHILCVHVIC